MCVSDFDANQAHFALALRGAHESRTAGQRMSRRPTRFVNERKRIKMSAVRLTDPRVREASCGLAHVMNGGAGDVMWSASSEREQFMQIGWNALI